MKLQKDELPHSLAISPGEQHFLLGTSWSLCYYDHKGNLLWRNDAPSTTFAVNIAANGKVAVAGFGDGTVRWYRLSDGQELLALFVHREDHRWVAWTPEGFYDASPGGEALFGYHLNQGPDREGVFVQVAQLREPFYRPDLIANRLSGNDAEIRQALARIGDVRQVLASGLPPELKWRDGLAEEVVSRPQQTLRVVAEDRGGGIGRAEFHLNGQLMQTAKGRYHEVQGPEGQRIFTLPVTLPDGDNQLEVILYNRDGQVASKPLVRRITLRDPNALPATLHVLAVGSDRYRGLMPDRVLDFAASDAARVADTLRRYGKGLFADTDVVTLLNPQAKLAGITKALEAMAKRVKPNDVFVLYLAGHAEGDGRNYYYLPWDFAHTGDGALQQHSLHSDRLAELLSHIPSSKRLLILDTCNAGNLLLAGLDTKYRSDLDASAIARLRNKAGRAILASTRSGMLALEGIDGSGAFTGVLLRGVGGAADRPKGREVQDGFVTVSELADYIGEELPRITLEKWHYEQIPMRQITGDSFPLTRVPAR
ncbi:caspase family protein [Endothiovibrio diazotrophicus]